MASTAFAGTTRPPGQASPAAGRRPPAGRSAGRSRSVAELDRRGLARELHDAVIQQVLAAGLAIASCRTEVAPGSPVHRQLEYAEALTRTAARRLRSLLQGLSAEAGIAGAELPDLVRKLVAEHANRPPRLSYEVSGTPFPLAPAISESLYRIAGECLFNCIVHGRARRAVISLMYRPGLVTLSVADDGQGDPETISAILRGAVPAAASSHTGLADIAGRCADIGAVARVDRSALGGITLHVLVPVRPPGPGPTGDGGDLAP
jgi:signal transduction histidine kinase